MNNISLHIFLSMVTLMFFGGAMYGSEFTKISISSYPLGSGYANKTVFPDANVEGAHLSGEKKVFVHESKSVISKKELSNLNELAKMVVTKPHAQSVSPEQRKTGFFSLVIRASGKSYVFYSKKNAKFKCDEAQQIWNIVSKLKVGAG